MGSYFDPDHQGGRGGCQQMPSPRHQAVPRFQDQVPSSSQGQIHGETSSPLHHCASFHSCSLKKNPGPIGIQQQQQQHWNTSCIHRRIANSVHSWGLVTTSNSAPICFLCYDIKAEKYQIFWKFIESCKGYS